MADGIAAGAGVPGRLERVDAGQPYLAVVDYAHKPDAVESVLRPLRPVTEGRLRSCSAAAATGTPASGR